ncbi:hypothetical protein D5086_024700 [Populus alba]|uniref:Uncharacterized protein n=1 Tax=Populus alba TaxID=43335 RepID=A0ACC4B7S4_POPAL
MANFNVVQKRRRAQISESKRAIHGDPLTKKLKNKTQPLTLSGKRKLLKNGEQKEAVDKVLVTMQDVEMAFAPGKTRQPEVLVDVMVDDTYMRQGVVWQ